MLRSHADSARLIAATLAVFAAAAFVSADTGAQATAQPAADRIGASDTGRPSAVHGDARRSERWYCTPTGCAGARASSGGAALGFAATTLAAAWISRQRPADRC